MTAGSSGKPPPLPPSLIRSKKRVADHGEVFTPAWLVEACSTSSRTRPSGSTPVCWNRPAGPATSSSQSCRKLAAVEPGTEERLREAALRAARAHVHIRHRATRGQHRRMPGEHAEIFAEYLRSTRRTTLPGRRAVLAEHRPWRCAHDDPAVDGDRSSSLSGPTRRGQVPAARLPLRRPDPARRSVEGHPVRRRGQARDLHARADLQPADDRRSWPVSHEPRLRSRSRAATRTC